MNSSGNEKGEVLNTLFLILQVGITMLVTFGLCFALGLWLDKQFGTKLLWVFIILGILSGYRAVYLLIRKHIKNNKKDPRQPDWAEKAFAGDRAENAAGHLTDRENPAFDIAKSDITNDDISKPDVTDVDIVKCDIAETDVASVDIVKRDIAEQDIASVDIVKRDIANADILEGEE